MNELIQLLRKRNLLGKNGPKIPTIDALSSTNIVDLLKEVREITTSTHQPARHSVFHFQLHLDLGEAVLNVQS